MEEYTQYDAIGLADLVVQKEVTPGELLEAALSRAEKAQDKLNCFSALFPDLAREQIANGLPDGVFTGVPTLTKDYGVEVAGAPLTFGSNFFKGYVAQSDSEIVRRYKAAGLVPFGQTTSPELAMSLTTESKLYGQTKNPWDIRRTTGGSSGGAAAAVASGVVPIAQASDGGGSIRVPAACNGLFGLKPSRGRTPQGPHLTEHMSGLSCLHALTRSVRDSALLLDISQGLEPGSRYSVPPSPTSYLYACMTEPEPLRVALWVNAPNGTKPDVDAHKGLYDTVRLLQDLGHWVEDADPHLDGEALGQAMLMTLAANVAFTLNEAAERLGRPVKDDELETINAGLYELGNMMPMEQLLRADMAFQKAAITFDQWMQEGQYDVVLMPTISRAPLWLGTLSLSPEDDAAYTEALTSFAPHCAVFNQTGCPAMSMPLHWTKDGLPLGMMFGARLGNEHILFQLAGQIERAKPWFDKTPRVFFGD